MASLTLVAEALTLGIPAASKTGSAAADSPEKAGPMTATTLPLISLLAPLLARAGLPWLSKGSTDTFTAGLVALYWLMASASPFLMLIPRAALAPVRAPKNPILSVVPDPAPAVVPPLAVVLLVVLLLLEPHAARPKAARATTAMALIRTGLAIAIRSPPRTCTTVRAVTIDLRGRGVVHLGQHAQKVLRQRSGKGEPLAA